jgi:hypothetical protein
MTRRFLSLFTLALAGWLVACCSLWADTTNSAPDFKEVYDLLRTNLPGATDETLNRTAVEGLLTQLHGKVALVGTVDGSVIPQGETALSKSAILESNVAYLRVSRIGYGLADKLSAAYRSLTATNKVVGVVLDLRFAGGDDYAAAVAAADLFVSKKTPLLDWGKGVVESNPAKEPIAGPLVVLVNGGTSGAAEALAAVLRESVEALIIGNPTAGEAKMFKEFPLNNGERLRIATIPVKLADGSTISHVPPDIAVSVSLDDERLFLKNPDALPAESANNTGVATNNWLSFMDHTSEADLVREKQKDGGGDFTPARSNSTPARAAEPEKPVIRDPVLARALDLIKGLAIVRESRF